MQGKTILVIDDEPEMLDLLAEIFSHEGARVVTAASGREALRQFHACRPDLVVLDLMLPDMDGLEVCARFRQLSDVPIILLTALCRDQDIVAGLDCGADEYIAKPFSPEVLLAHSRAVLRRAELSSLPDQPIRYDDSHLFIDLERRQVRRGGTPVRLTSTEYGVLACLLRRMDQACSYAHILEQVWGQQYQDSPEYIHVYVNRLRQKLEEDPAHPRYLVTVYGVGYAFRRPE